MPETKPLPEGAEEKRGGYSGSMDAEQVPPPPKVPSGSVSKESADPKPSED